MFHSAYKRLQNSQPNSIQEAQRFLDSLDNDTQAKIVAAIYLGREHLDHNSLRDDVEISTSYIDTISSKEYARIIYEKSGNIEIYLNKLEVCANSSNFDLASL